MRNVIVVTALILVLGLVNWSIFTKEQHLQHGKIVYLELAPVDPRSLMQGDFMTLRFSIGNEIRNATRGDTEQEPKRLFATTDGKAVVTLDNNQVATFHSLTSEHPLESNKGDTDQGDSDQLELRYRVRNGRVKFATNAFFFQEGHAAVYEAARYGEFRVNGNGDVLLTALMDEELKKLVPELK